MAPSSKQPGKFGAGGWKAFPHGVGQLWVRRGSGQGLQAGAKALGAMTWAWTWPEVAAGPRAFGWVAWGFTSGSFKQAEWGGL